MGVEEYWRDDEGWSVETWFWMLFSASTAAFLAYLYYVSWNTRKLGELFGNVLRAAIEKDGALWARLHPTTQATCEKPFVTAYQRSIKDRLGRVTCVHASTLEIVDDPDEIVHMRGRVSFEKEDAMVDLAWHETTKAITAIQLEPESAELSIAEHVNDSALEQKSDTFMNGLFHGRINEIRKMMHGNLSKKLKDDDLLRQGEAVKRAMGEAVGPTYEVDSSFQTGKLETLQGGAKALQVKAVLRGHVMDAEATFLWLFHGMTSSLLKFEVRTTGKPHKETVFVNPDGTPYSPQS